MDDNTREGSDDNIFNYGSKSVLKRKQHKTDDICWSHPPNFPWDVSWYFSVRGAENMHLYLWILKDLSWTQDWYISGFIFGILAVMWSIYILSHTIHHRNIKEFWTGVGQVLWLSANLWWMTGELHDNAYPDSVPQYPQRTKDAGHMMLTAIIWLGIYYISIKPFYLFAPSAESEKLYDIKRLKPRFPFFFATWREYENVHILFWLGKDYGWNLLSPAVWITFLTPTLLVALDFAYISFFDPRLLVEHCHYIAQFGWVMGNMVWAMGEIFIPENDFPYNLFSQSPTRLHYCRWYSSWVLVLTFIPIIVLYIIWFRAHRRGTYVYEKTWKTIKSTTLRVKKKVREDDMMVTIEMLGATHNPMLSQNVASQLHDTNPNADVDFLVKCSYQQNFDIIPQ